MFIFYLWYSFRIKIYITHARKYYSNQRKISKSKLMMKQNIVDCLTHLFWLNVWKKSLSYLVIDESSNHCVIKHWNLFLSLSLNFVNDNILCKPILRITKVQRLIAGFTTFKFLFTMRYIISVLKKMLINYR